MLEAYNAQVAERAALGIPALPLTKDQTAELVKLLKSPPAGKEAELLELITNRVPAGVDDAAKEGESSNEFKPSLAQLEAHHAGYVERPAYRPITKFENRGIKLGHGVWDLVYKKV